MLNRTRLSISLDVHVAANALPARACLCCRDFVAAKVGTELDDNVKFGTDLESKFGTSSVNSRFPA